MRSPDRIFKRLLRLFPAEFRGDFGDDMTRTFRDQHHDTVAHGGGMGLIRLWWETLVGIVRTAPQEHLDLLRQDVRYGIRNLWRSPGFAIVAIAALAAGIAANIAVFSIVNGVLLSALPYRDPGRLVLVFEQVPDVEQRFDFAAPDYEVFRRAARSFSDVAAYRNASYELSGIAQSERIVAARVSPSLFTVLGVSPILGRALSEDDDRQGARVAVLSASLWSSAFGRDPSIVGRTIALDRQPYTIVGVLPDRFEFPQRGGTSNSDPAALFVPIAFSPFELGNFGGMYNNTLIARLKLGVTIEQARAEMASTVRAVVDAYPAQLTELAKRLSLPIFPFNEEIVGRTRRLLMVLMGAVGIVLLIGCADVANLMLTRAGSRQRELAIRTALGASPARVVRQLLTEGFVLAALGGAAGLLLAYWVMGVLLSLAGETLPRATAIGFDGRVVAFAVLLALITPLLFGVAPALRAALGTTAESLKDASRGTTAGRTRHRMLSSLVVAQFALALILSVGAGLLVRSFARLISTDPGFRAEQVVSVAATLPAGRYTTGQQVKAFYQDVVGKARGIPGVTSAGAGNDLPLHVLERRGFQPDASARVIPPLSRITANTWTEGGYFQSLGIPLERGRFFTDADGASGERVIIISKSLANTLWPGQDAVGRQLAWGIETSHGPWKTIVGVVGDVKQSTLDTPTVAQTYVPLAQVPEEEVADTITGIFRTVNLVARSDRDGDAVMADLRGVIQRLDSALPIAKAQTLTDLVGESTRPQRFSMTVVSLFALVALALAGIGIYGVLASVVAQQRHEIGVRMALGATTRDVLSRVLRQAFMLMAVGVGIGVVGALALTRWMSSLLYEIRPSDAPTFLASALVLAALAFVASVAPAWRATRVDPLIALREE